MKLFKSRLRIKPESQQYAIGDRVTLSGKIVSVSAGHDGGIRYMVIADDTYTGTSVSLRPDQIRLDGVSDERG